MPTDTERTIEELEGKVAALEYYVAVLLKQASTTNPNPESIKRIVSRSVPNASRTTLTGIFNKSVHAARTAIEQHMKRIGL